jgi:hypothetical protein
MGRMTASSRSLCDCLDFARFPGADGVFLDFGGMTAGGGMVDGIVFGLRGAAGVAAAAVERVAGRVSPGSTCDMNWR